ncbi:MAG: tetratricopeptide repeat protein, partial [Polyangiaceae bacterium]
SLISALRSLFAFASDDGTRLAIQLRLATLIESFANESPDITSATTMGILRESLDRFRAGLHIDPLSVTAATGLARVAPRMQDAEGSFAAASSLAELSVNPRARARYLLDAADILLRAGPDERLGKGPERRTKACILLERAIDTDPDSIPAAGRLATVRQENGESEKIVDTFRNAIKRAKAADSIVLLGSEIARVARDELNDLPLGIEAMRRVREAAPNHAPSLLTLAELCIAQRSWPEAVDALEAVVNGGRDPAPRLTALFALASIYEHVLSKPNDAEDSIRKALEIDPANARALKALLRHITSVRNASMEDLGREEREEVASLFERLTNVERDPVQRCDLLLQLADSRNKLGDKPAVERALIEATAQNPASVSAFARLAACFRTPPAVASDPWTRDHVAHARALAQVIGRGSQLGKVDARWYAALGQIEIESLGRVRDGITHLQQAVQLDPDLHEVRLELAKAFTRASAHDEASRVLVAMLAPQ